MKKKLIEQIIEQVLFNQNGYSKEESKKYSKECEGSELYEAISNVVDGYEIKKKK
jgi:hypothetical protein